MNNWMGWFLTELSNLMTANGSLFLSGAVTLAKVCVGIVIACIGVKMAFGTGDKGTGLRAFVRIAIVLAMLNWYNAPVPGVGLSFPQIVSNEGVWLAQQIEGGSSDSLNNTLNTVMEDESSPDGWSVMSYIRCAILVIVVIAAQAALLFVVGFGYIAMEIFILIGPFFVTSLLFSWSESYFWGWLKGLLAYSFYPVVADAYVWIMARFYTDFLNAHPLPWALSNVPTLVTLFCAITVAFIFGILKVPSLVSHLFSGGSGEHAFPGIGMWR